MPRKHKKAHNTKPKYVYVEKKSSGSEPATIPVRKQVPETSQRNIRTGSGRKNKNTGGGRRKRNHGNRRTRNGKFASNGIFRSWFSHRKTTEKALVNMVFFPESAHPVRWPAGAYSTCLATVPLTHTITTNASDEARGVFSPYSNTILRWENAGGSTSSATWGATVSNLMTNPFLSNLNATIGPASYRALAMSVTYFTTSPITVSQGLLVGGLWPQADVSTAAPTLTGIKSLPDSVEGQAASYARAIWISEDNLQGEMSSAPIGRETDSQIAFLFQGLPTGMAITFDVHIVYEYEPSPALLPFTDPQPPNSAVDNPNVVVANARKSRPIFTVGIAAQRLANSLKSRPSSMGGASNLAALAIPKTLPKEAKTKMESFKRPPMHFLLMRNRGGYHNRAPTHHENLMEELESDIEDAARDGLELLEKAGRTAYDILEEGIHDISREGKKAVKQATKRLRS